MTRRSLWHCLLLALGLSLAPTPQAEELLMARTPQAFPEAMLELQEAIKQAGYEVSRVQRVDIGLTQSGYQTDRYRIVFFGRADELRQITARHPELLAVMPLKVAIFAEESDTLLVSARPTLMFSSDDAQLRIMAARWEADLRAIFARLREAGG